VTPEQPLDAPPKPPVDKKELRDSKEGRRVKMKISSKSTKPKKLTKSG